MNRDAESWLFERLKFYGVDVYIDGKFESLRDRMANVIVTEDISDAIAGRRHGKKESFGAVFERIYGVSVDKLVTDVKLQNRARNA